MSSAYNYKYINNKFRFVCIKYNFFFLQRCDLLLLFHKILSVTDELIFKNTERKEMHEYINQSVELVPLE